jgi:hypothetical protein
LIFDWIYFKNFFSLNLNNSNAIRETRFGALSSTGDDDTRAILGKMDKEFSFSDLKNPIEFMECCAAHSNTQLESVINWLEINA